MSKDKNLVEEAIIQMKNLEETVAENAKGILASTMGQEIKELVKESLSEAEEDEQEEIDTEVDMDMDMDDESSDEEDSLEMDDMDMDADKSTDSDEVIDLRGQPDSQVLKVFQLMDDNDEVVVTKDDADNIHLKDGEKEYMIVQEGEEETHESEKMETEMHEMDDMDEFEFETEKSDEGSESDIEKIVADVFGDSHMDESTDEDTDEDMDEEETIYEITMDEEMDEEMDEDWKESSEEMTEDMDEDMDEELDEETDEDTEEMTEDMDEEMYEDMDEDMEEGMETSSLAMESKMTSKPKGVGMGSPKFKYSSKPNTEGGFKVVKKKANKTMGTGKAKFEYKEGENMEGKMKPVKGVKKMETKEASRTLGSGSNFRKGGLPKPRAHSAFNANIKESENSSELQILREKNEEYRKALNVFRSKLNEVAVFNSNLAYATRLFTEHTTSKQEKINILRRFDGVESLKESKNLYKTIKDELSNETSKPVNESIERIVENTQASGSVNLIESKTYENPQFLRMKDLMNKLK